MSSGIPRHISAADGVYGNSVRLILTAGVLIIFAAAKIGRVKKGASGGIQLGHEGVGQAGQSTLESPRRRGEVARLGVSRHVSVARGIHRDGQALVENDRSTAETSGVEEGGAVRIQLGDKSVISQVRRLKSARRCREGAYSGCPREVGVAGGVHRDGSALTITGAPQVSEVAERGVDDERLAVVVGCHLKPDAVLAPKDIAAVERVARRKLLLVDDRLLEANFTAVGLDHEIAICRDSQGSPASALCRADDVRRYIQPYGLGVCARGHDEIVFQLPPWLP